MSVSSGNIFKVILRKLWFYLKKLLNYPFNIRKKFDYYNYIIYLIYDKTKEKNTLKLRKRNHLLINTLIFLPLFLGVIYSGLTLYANKDRFQKYYQRVTLPLDGQTSVKKTFSFFKRGYLSVVNQPVEFSDLNAIIYGYLFSICGAFLLSKHPAFKKQKEIEDVLLNTHRVDEDGNPWKVVWTPQAIYFEAYNCDVHKFIQETKFWNSINFTPDQPKLIPEDKRKFIIPAKFELPAQIQFNGSESMFNQQKKSI